MKKVKNLALPALFVIGMWALSAVVGPETWHSWTPIMLGVLAMAIYAHFQVKFENIEMDLDMIEEALDRIEPDYHHQVARFRYGRSRPDILNPRADNASD